MPKERLIATLRLPDHLAVFSLNPEELPDRWWINPAPLQLAQIGQKWVEEKSAVTLVVPSSVTPTGEGRNYILNPQHPDFLQIEILKIAHYDYDARLFI